MKRILFLVVVLVLLTTLMAYAENEIIKYNYETVLETALSNAVQPELDDYHISAMESALEDARLEAKKGFIGGTPQEVVERTIIKQVAPIEAEVNLEIAKRKKLDNEKRLKHEVFNELMQVVLSEEKIALKKKRIELLEEMYDIDMVQFREGMLSEADIADEELALSVEKLELTKMETALAEDILDIKQKMHIDLSDENKIAFEYQLGEIGSPYLVHTFDINKAVEKALESDTEVYRAEKALEAAEMKFEITKERLKPGNDYYDYKEYEMESARKNLYDTKTNLEVSVRNAYNDLLTASDAVKLEKKRLELEENRLSTLLTKYDAGIISRREIIESEVKVLAQRQAVLDAILDFNLKNEALRNFIER
ncbi:MAG: TolC family protein [Bacillota bacterium]|jgi:outer membrane protein TolC|nr:TolC family protein [Bacillota bacterium]NLV62417.1 TolC family protein [Clostridiaceae bacterium]